MKWIILKKVTLEKQVRRSCKSCVNRFMTMSSRMSVTLSLQTQMASIPSITTWTLLSIRSTPLKLTHKQRWTYHRVIQSKENLLVIRGERRGREWLTICSSLSMMSWEILIQSKDSNRCLRLTRDRILLSLHLGKWGEKNQRFDWNVI